MLKYVQQMNFIRLAQFRNYALNQYNIYIFNGKKGHYNNRLTLISFYIWKLHLHLAIKITGLTFYNYSTTVLDL